MVDLPLKSGIWVSSPTFGAIFSGLKRSDLRKEDWPLSVKVSVNWGADEPFATIRQYSAETRQNSHSQMRVKPDWFLDSENHHEIEIHPVP
jgi:hypothetical protein